jgi:N-methylhydantoinase B
MQDVVNRALAEAIPDRVHAGGARWAGIPMLSGIDQDGMPWGHMLFNGGPGGGASPHADGWPLITTNAAQGGLKSASVEHTELLYPIDVEHWEIAEGSMGLGRRIGGPGVECRVHMRRDTQMVIQTDGNRNPPHGVVGGTPGRGGGHYATAADGSRAFLPGTVFATLLAGERWTSVSTGGGGYGDPLEREPLRVAVDVADGLYDAPTADAVFGVVVVAGPVPAVDDDATERRRAELAAARPALEGAGVVPVAPAASTWLDDTRLEGDVVIDAIADGRVATGGGDAR